LCIFVWIPSLKLVASKWIFFIRIARCHTYFHTQNPTLGKFWRVLERKLWHTYLWPFLIFYAHLVYFVVLWFIFPVLLCCTKKDLATLVLSKRNARWSNGVDFMNLHFVLYLWGGRRTFFPRVVDNMSYIYVSNSLKNYFILWHFKAIDRPIFSTDID
jgi:hypothetical protein